MAGRGPAMPNGWVYIMTNRRNGTHIGVTGDLIRRVWEHREGISEGFIAIVMAGLVPAMTATCYMGHNQRDLV